MGRQRPGYPSPIRLSMRVLVPVVAVPALLLDVFGAMAFGFLIAGLARLARSATLPRFQPRFSRATRRRFAQTLLWWTSALALVDFFAAVRSNANNTGMPVHGAGLEGLLFGGLPTVWLQHHVLSVWPEGFSWVFVIVHASWFVTPFVAIGVVSLFRPVRLGSLVGCWFGLFALAHLVFLMWPTEPPWMANHDVVRVLEMRVGAIGDPNPLAAMPSLHVAMPLLFGLWFLRERWLAPAWAFIAWSAVISVEVVMSGEHYVIDVFGAALVAGAVVMLAPHLGRLASRAIRMIGTQVQRLSPGRLSPRVSGDRGQALIELAFILPVMLVLVGHVLRIGG